MKFISSLFILGIFLSVQARAESIFVPRLINYKLKEQLATDEKRLIPQWEMVSIAMDVDIWKHATNNYYYHGPGYWADVYTEVRPFEDLRINGKFTFANGSTSYGYNQRDFNSLFFGVTWGPDILPDPWKFELIFFDLDRTTLGAGLFFEDREMSGMSAKFYEQNWVVDVRLPGTGVLQTFGDLWSIEIFRQSSANEAGFHGFLIQDYAYEVPDPSMPGGTTMVMDDMRSVGSLFIRSKPHLFTQYRAEGAYSFNEKFGGLAGVGIQDKLHCRFCYSVMAQYRYFEDDMLERLAGNTDYDYVPYSLHDRPYDNPINSFRSKDEMQTYSLDIDFKFRMTQRWYFESHNEVGQFNYKNYRDESFVYHKQTFAFCPYEKYKENCLQLYVGNQLLRAFSPYSMVGMVAPPYERTTVFGIHGVFFL